MGHDEFDEFFHAEFPLLIGFLCKAGFALDPARDAAAEAMLNAYEDWRTITHPHSWIRRVGYRRAKEQTAARTDWACPDAGREDKLTALADEASAVLTMLGRLPKRQQLGMAWALDGFTAREIAGILGIAEESVSTTLRHARGRLEEHDPGFVSRLDNANTAFVDALRMGLDVDDTLSRIKNRAMIRELALVEPGSPAAAEPEQVAPARWYALDAPVAAAGRGDQRALETLLSTVRPLVIRYCRARIGRQERTYASADDVAQEVCVAILRALPTYREQGRPFLAFVYGIAQHKVADARRAAARNRSDPVAEVPDGVAESAGPEQHALHNELSDRMGELLRILPDRQREIVVLRIVVGLSAEETAAVVGSTAGAVRVAQHRALTRLRKILTEVS
ncbi:RNA polymerase sigma factor ShbA [Amycolatopsis regifaucium]|uniref:RNA polymerase subunit sigma-70 n=1 Tax=Amycolatopsis regifaucium TaxID=546365 RepID=A0ABX3DI81_9PSEU|nr:RNA polymerase sigma factor ShbA [Amycolatopsis regifaucium]OKA03861.1 RNA polymerase subunit sigma-70 [Amycolatopsis regifaucium]SFJ65623.1 RNA polymerase sigma-70 factor, ECF subfamily [Amycolatopsis regifaucium]